MYIKGKMAIFETALEEATHLVLNHYSPLIRMCVKESLERVAAHYLFSFIRETAVIHGQG